MRRFLLIVFLLILMYIPSEGSIPDYTGSYSVEIGNSFTWIEDVDITSEFDNSRYYGKFRLTLEILNISTYHCDIEGDFITYTAKITSEILENTELNWDYEPLEIREYSVLYPFGMELYLILNDEQLENQAKLNPFLYKYLGDHYFDDRSQIGGIEDEMTQYIYSSDGILVSLHLSYNIPIFGFEYSYSIELENYNHVLKSPLTHLLLVIGIIVLIIAWKNKHAIRAVFRSYRVE